ncbi:hypothetical protein [Sodalis sp. RH22]|uniref:hypothetical protein n=1 Tax=unclassified Sodalis (in: enterobacteria) TaxID=2636512 RepID=UPI0039B6DB28
MPINYLEGVLSKLVHSKHPLVIAALMLFIAIMFGLLTLIFIYVSSNAKTQVDAIRQDYQRRADRRDLKVDEIAAQQKSQGNQLNELQHKVDTLPLKTAEKVKQDVKDDAK